MNESHVMDIDMSQMRSVKYFRPTVSSDGSQNINNRITVARTESGQHRHIQAVNKGYLLAASNEAYSNSRANRKKPKKPMVVPSTKPSEEQEEDYDSDYSEVAITTGLQDSQGTVSYTHLRAHGDATLSRMPSSA